MSELAPDLKRALSVVAGRPRLLVCCDFDGTLSHLVDDPREARPVEGAVEVMEGLGALQGTTAALVSGRSLEQLVAAADMAPHVQLIGSHGAESRAGEINGLGAQQVQQRDELVIRCQRIVDAVPGAFIEVKPASVAVHVRQATDTAGAAVLRQVREGPATVAGVHVTEGKDVIELAVVRTGKGRAVNALRGVGGDTAVLFIGDDVTDEDAFGVLVADDVGIKVGEGQTLAPWRVAAPEDVVAALSLVWRERARLPA